MEESNHPLGMKVFEIQDTVAGHKSLTEAVIQRLMTAEDFSPLPPNLQRRVFGHMIPTPSWLVAEVSGAAIIVTNQWVVSIYGDSLFSLYCSLSEVQKCGCDSIGDFCDRRGANARC